MMKKVTALALSLGFIFCLFAGCGSEPTTAGGYTVRVAALKGPTVMGMLHEMARNDALPEEEQPYAFAIYGAADEITPLLVNGSLDMAAIPANLAAVLHQKTDGEIQVVAINTLGVLNVLQTGESITGIESLRGKTVYMTGLGTVPEYTFSYILQQNGLTPGVDVFLEFKSEPAEVGAILAGAQQGDEIIAVLPQPYATAVCMQNEGVSIAIDLAQEYKTLTGQEMVTGVLVARKTFIEENPDEFAAFMQAYQASIIAAQTDVEATANLVVAYDILGAQPVAQKALPLCNITFITGGEMREILQGYYEILFAANPASVGGALAGDAFYHVNG